MNYENINDEKLAKMSKSDDRACEILIVRYKGTVISLARKYYLQGGEIDDLISEGMIGLYRAVMTYQEDKNATFFTYAYICISRQLYSAIRNSLSNKNVPLNQSLPIYQHEELSGGIQPEELFIYKEGEAKLMGKLRECLSVFEFQVLTDYIEGLSYQEISDKRDCPFKKVDNALFRSKKKVNDLIKKNNIKN